MKKNTALNLMAVAGLMGCEGVSTHRDASEDEVRLSSSARQSINSQTINSHSSDS